MQAKNSSSKTSIFRRESIAVFVTVVNAFAWYTLVYVFLADIFNKLPVTNTEMLLTFAFHYAGVAISAFLSPFVVRKFADRNVFLTFWVLLGVFASASLTLLETNLPTSAYAISLLLGLSIGIGLPSCLSFFADIINIENRGKTGGVLWVASGLVTLSLAVASYSVDTFSKISMLAVLRAVGLLFFFFKPTAKKQKSETIPSYASILGDTQILLYLVPWIMFCLINWTESPIVENLFGEEFFDFVTFVEVALSGVFALVGGFFADLVGRKRVIITGFIMLGIEYAVLNFFNEAIAGRYVYIFLDGISWGMFAAIFFIALWGDLGKGMSKEKFYVVGGLPYLLAGFLQVVIRQYVGSIPVNTAFSLASFFLFVAVIPLMYASETLPEKKIKDRELKQYVEKAKKVKEKYA